METRGCTSTTENNVVTRKGSHPLPRIEDLLDTLRGSMYFRTFDPESGHWQVKVKGENKEKTAFITHSGLYDFNIIPFRFTNAPATFQRLMTIVLTGLMRKYCLGHIDDNIIFSNTFTDNNEKRRVVLKRLQDADLKLKTGIMQIRSCFGFHSWTCC